MQKDNQSILVATKWSMFSEVLSKLVAPVTSMILARILTPSAFGAVATIAMVNSFADIFADAGFQKYIIQHKFNSESEKYSCISVAFWANLLLSFFLWLVIIIFRHRISRLVGSPGLENAFIVAGISIPLVALYGLLSSVFKKDLDFKTLFQVRMVSVGVPILITIPLSFYIRSYWALILGTLSVNLSNFCILFYKSKWKPSFYFNFSVLKEMLSFSVWVLIDALMAWIVTYLDIFLIGLKLNEHYIGLYKTSIALVAQIFAIVSSTVLPVMLPALSRVQGDSIALKALLMKFQKYTAIFIFPICAVLFIFRDSATTVLLGPQWLEASEFIGYWSLTQLLILIFSRFCTVIYPAIGRPKFSVFSQVAYIAVFIPAIIVASNYGFRPLYLTACAIRIWGIIIDFILVYYLIRLTPLRMLANIKVEILICCFAIIPSIIINYFTRNFILQFFGAASIILIFYSFLLLFTNDRFVILSVLENFLFKYKRCKSQNA